MDYLLLIVGFVLLIKGADLFVDGASSIAAKLKVPSIIIGLTIVAFGTSAPEAAVSVTAALEGNNGIAVGNVIGSNIFNLLFVIGLSAVIRTLPVEKGLFKKDYPLSILASVMLAVMAADKLFSGTDNVLSRSDGIMLLLVFCIFLYSTISAGLAARKNVSSDISDEDKEKIKKPFWQCILLTAAGIAGIVIGGDITVNAATGIALTFGMSETLVGLTIVAVGTSLPELVTSVIATKKGENDLALGNVVGSNIFNILFILGISGTINPIAITADVLADLLILIAVNIIVFLAIFKERKIRRPLGVIMLLMYIADMVYAVMR